MSFFGVVFVVRRRCSCCCKCRCSSIVLVFVNRVCLLLCVRFGNRCLLLALFVDHLRFRRSLVYTLSCLVSLSFVADIAVRRSFSSSSIACVFVFVFVCRYLCRCLSIYCVFVDSVCLCCRVRFRYRCMCERRVDRFRSSLRFLFVRSFENFHAW